MTVLHITLLVWFIVGFVVSIKRMFYYNKTYGSITVVDLWICVIILLTGPLVVTVEYIITIVRRRIASNRIRKTTNVETL